MFVGAVKYLEQNGLLQELANAIGSLGLGVFEHPSNRAKLLLLKRKQFSHEAEVRLIIVGKYPHSSDEIARVEIDPNALFDEMSFDRRLNPAERGEREATMRSLDMKVRFTLRIFTNGLCCRWAWMLRLRAHEEPVVVG